MPIEETVMNNGRAPGLPCITRDEESNVVSV